MRDLKQPNNPNVLVGFDLSDDAGVYRLNNDLALVQTVDIFTPVVDDAFDYGRIAAANALSDIYAMGGRPLTALNIAAFPRQTLPFEVLGEILRGGLAKVTESAAVVVGGHTVENTEPLYGLSVTGLVHPERIATNAGAQIDDVLVLTKPIGTGIVSTAIKFEACSDEIARVAIESMAQLNRAACETMLEIGLPADVHACTDITGFGLLGHALEMAQASQVTIEIEAGAVPLLPGVEELARDGQYVPGGGARNAQHVAAMVEYSGDLPDYLRHALTDPQTSGGLLIAVVPARVTDLIRALNLRGVVGAIIGRVTEGAPRITVRG